MGKLIKNHWARLIILTASTYQIAAALEGFFWPKIFWDFATKNLDGAVKPIPALQVLNLLFGILGLLWEWPLGFIATTSIHRSIEARLAVYPLSALMAILLYQATNPAIYYLVGVGVYFWAYSEGEVCASTLLCPCRGFWSHANMAVLQSVSPVPWTLPKRGGSAPREKV